MDLFEANLDKMSRNAKRHSIGLRPHAKTHKCPEIARRQVEAGALGACTATIHEAEVLAAGGIRGLLITSEMVGRNKVERLLALTQRQPDTLSVVDDLAHARQLNDAAEAGTSGSTCWSTSTPWGAGQEQRPVIRPWPWPRES